MRKLLIFTAALAAIAPAAAAAADIACPTKIAPDLIAALGEPVAWLGTGQTVHSPAGLTMLGYPVAYVIAFHAGDGTGPIAELDYRLQGLTRPYGDRYGVDLRKAFDKGFDGSNCGSAQNTSCVVDYKANADGDLSGAELSEGNVAMPKEAHGDGLAPVKADYNLDGSDPVFLACHYQAPK